MSDPFAPKSNSSALRDAQVGLLLVAVLLGVFVYVAYYRISGKGKQLPAHVRMAPVATAVWPNGPPESQPDQFAPQSQASTLAATRPSFQPNAANRRLDAASSIPSAPKTAFSKASFPETRTPGISPFEASAPKPLAQPATEVRIASTVPNKQLHTDHQVAPVDFQKAASESAAKHAVHTTADVQVLNRLGSNPGDQFDPKLNKSRQHSPAENMFGGTLKSQPSKIRIAPPRAAAKSTIQSVPIEQKVVKQGTAFAAQTSGKEFRPKLVPKLLPNLVPQAQPKPVRSAFDQSRNASMIEQDFEPPNKMRIPNARIDRAAEHKNELRLEGARPRMKSPAPSLRSEKKRLVNSFLPKTVPPPQEQADFHPQQDIAKSARVISFPTVESAPKRSTAQPAIEKTVPQTALKTNPGGGMIAIENPKPKPDVHVTRAGDSFWSIATERYQDGRWFDALYRWNAEKVRTFDDLPAGVSLEIPGRKELANRWPDLCPAEEPQAGRIAQQTIADYDAKISERLYITGEGDTLFGIAAKKLGQASRYVDIMTMNDQRIPAGINHSAPLKPGLRLVLPE